MAMIEINWRPDARQLRWFGWFGAAAAGAIGTWIFLRHGLVGIAMSAPAAKAAACVLWGVAVAFAALAAAWPRGLRPIYVALTIVALPIGVALSYTMMIVLFYGLFTPIGLVFRLIGRDSLYRKFDPRADSYWVPRPTVQDVRRYFRQF